MTSLFEQHPQWLVSQPVFVSPNLRLSRTITAAFDQIQQQSCWEPLASYSWSQWLYTIYTRLELRGRNVPQLLNGQQELLLWNQVLRESDDQLLNPAGLARQLQKTRTLMIQYQLSEQQLSEAGHQGTEHFLQWLRDFERLMKQQHRICEYELASWLSQQKIRISRPIVLYEFPDLTPLQQGFLDTINRDTNPVFFFEHHPHRQIQANAHADKIQQYQAAVDWAQGQLEQNSNQKIAIIIPELSSDLVMIESLLQKTFHPELLSNFENRQSPGYNISASHSAATFQIIADALRLLEFNHQDIAIEAVDQVLHSPYFLKEQQHHFYQAGIIYRQIRERKSPTIRLTEVIEIAAQSQCPQLHDTLMQFAATVPKYSKREQLLTLWEWLNRFQHQLTLFGWPGNHELDSYEFQQASLWQDIITECASLENVLQKPIGLEAALQYLQQTAQQTQFHLQTIDSPLQILGILESRGLLFDKIWICGMDHNHWPPAANPDPFIPVSLQKDHNIPQCSADKELRYAEQITREWLQHSTELWISYVHTDNDSAQLLSPLFNNASLCEPVLQSPTTNAITHAEIEMVDDHSRILWDWQEPIPGGAGFLKDYIGCPFKAWSRHIMKSVPFAETVIGLDYQDRGILVHDIMEQLWRQIRDQQTLLNYQENELFQLVAELVGRRVNRYCIMSRRYISPLHRDLEVKRLCKTLMLWLQIEKQRPPFRVIFNESKQQYQIGRLTLNIRFDRIDKLQDNSLMVVDYKTGEPKIASWLNNGRIDEPQVPIYSLVFQHEVKVAAFASLKTGHLELIGVKDDDIEEIATIKTVSEAFTREADAPTSFTELMHRWQSLLTITSDEISTQEIAVRPASPTVCRQCDQSRFCRIALEDLDKD